MHMNGAMAGYQGHDSPEDLDKKSENLQGLIASLIQIADERQALVLNQRKHVGSQINREEIQNEELHQASLPEQIPHQQQLEYQINQHSVHVPEELRTHPYHGFIPASNDILEEHDSQKLNSHQHHHVTQMTAPSQVNDLLTDADASISQLMESAAHQPLESSSAGVFVLNPLTVANSMQIMQPQQQEYQLQEHQLNQHQIDQQQLQQQHKQTLQYQMQLHNMQLQQQLDEQQSQQQEQPFQLTEESATRKRTSVATSTPKPDREIVNRRRYTDSEKATIIAIYRQYNVKEAALTVIRSIPTFERVDRNMIKRWMKKAVKGGSKLGRPVCPEFERDVLQMCLKEAQNTGCRLDDTMLSYSTVRRCAKAAVSALYPDDHGNPVQKWHMFQDKLKFSNKWVNGFIKRLREAQEYQNIAAAASAAASAAGSASSSDGMFFNPDGSLQVGVNRNDASPALLQQMAMFSHNSSDCDNDGEGDNDDNDDGDDSDNDSSLPNNT